MKRGFAPIIVLIIAAIVAIGIGGYLVFVQQEEPVLPAKDAVQPAEEPAPPAVTPMPQLQNVTGEAALDEVTQNLHFFEDPVIDLTQIKVNVFFFVPRNLTYGNVLKDYFNLIESGAFYGGDTGAALDVNALTEKLTSRTFPAMQEFHEREFGSDLKLEFAVYPKTIYGFEEDRFYQSDLREVPPREVMNKINSELRNRVFTKTGDLYDQAFVKLDDNEYTTNVIIYAGFPPMSDDVHGQTIFTPAFTNYSKSTFLVFSPLLEPRATFNADSMIYHELLHTLGVPEQYNVFSLDFFIERNERADIMGRGSDKSLLNTYIGEDIKRKMGALPGGFEPLPDEEELFRGLSEEAKSFFTISRETRRHYDDSNLYKSFFRDRDRDGLVDTMDSGGYLHLTPRWLAFRSTSSLSGIPAVFYRYVKDCPTRETIERQIIDTSYGYGNYQGTDRYREQCIKDNSFDLYYVESLVPLEGTPSP